MEKAKTLFKWILVVFALGLISSCASSFRSQPDESNPIVTVAILPFSNLSNNAGAPEHLRGLLSNKLTAKFYKVIPLQQIDERLVDELGITLGEQLSELEFEQIHSIINADAYVYGDILHYDQITSGILNINRVSARLKMIQSRNEMVFWHSNIGIKSEVRSGGFSGSLASLVSLGNDIKDSEIHWITLRREAGGDGSIVSNLISGLLVKTLSSAFGLTLKFESAALISRSTMTLRNGPGF